MSRRNSKQTQWKWIILTGLGTACWSSCGWSQQQLPRTGWGDSEQAEVATAPVASDVQTIYDRTGSATSVSDLTSIIETCRNIAGDTTRSPEEQTYAKKTLSWAANRRGETRSDLAGELVQKQRIDEALKLDRMALNDFRLAIEHDASRWRAHHNLGVALALTGDSQKAMESFSTVLDLQPQFVDALANRGELAMQLGDVAAALADFDQALELASKDPALYSARARAKSANEDLLGSLADYATAMELEPESSDVATSYADCCQSLGRWKEAAAAYQKAMKLAPTNPRSLQNAAWMMATCPDETYRDPDAALRTAQRAIDATEGEPGVHRLQVLGVSQAAAGDFASAIVTLDDAMKRTTDSGLRKEIAMQRALFQRKRPYLQPQ